MGDELPTIRILHVDDDATVRDVTKETLEGANERITVQSEETVAAGLEAVEKGDIDCIVSEYTFPTDTGLVFLREVRANGSELPFILFTGTGTEDVAAEAISAGVDEYVQKSEPDSYFVLADNIQRVTDDYRAEQALSHRLGALESAGEGISILNEFGRLIYVNDAYTELYGYDRDDLLGESWGVLFPGDNGEWTPERILDVVGETDQWTGDIVHIRADGSRVMTNQSLSTTDTEAVICLAHSVPREDGSGATEQLLAQERERFDLLVDAITEYAIVGLDPKGNITSWNSGSHRINGYPEDEILDKHVSVLYTTGDIDVEMPKRDLDRALAEGTIHEAGWRVRKDGSRYWADVTITPVDNEHDDHRGFVCVMRDMTDRIRREKQLQRRIDQLDKFAGVLSHDLRNPLSTAVSSLELVRMNPDGGEEHLQRADEALDRIDNLIDSLLNLARQGEVVSEFEPVSLTEVARRAWGVVEAPEAELVIGDDTNGLEADSERLQTLFENLFRNAVEHAGPAVTVHVGESEGGFFVEDDGPGIPEEKRERVFEHGYSEKDGGTGFGLSIVKSIADAHGWELTMTEGSEGGARFEFSDLVR